MDKDHNSSECGEEEPWYSGSGKNGKPVFRSSTIEESYSPRDKYGNPSLACQGEVHNGAIIWE